MRQTFRVLNLLFFLLLAACGGDEGDSNATGPQDTTPTPEPTLEPTAEPSPDFSELSPLIDDFNVTDMAVVIGDASGELYRYEKGLFSVNTPIFIASANKWLTGATVWRLVEQGILSPQDTPQTYIDFWTTEVSDARSEITLDMLLGLTSGFNNNPVQVECIGRPTFSLYECVRTLYDGGLDSYPGTAFSYGPEHFQIAALMASAAQNGKDFRQIMRDELFDVVGMSSATGYNEINNDNARYSGSIVSTAADYGLFLRALLAGELFVDLEGFLADRNENTLVNYRPGGLENSNFDWHYAFGFWKECDATPYIDECNQQAIVSSPGAFGFTPWVDFNKGYWGIIAFEGNQEVPGFESSRESVVLEQQLQVMIEALLD